MYRQSQSTRPSYGAGEPRESFFKHPSNLTSEGRSSSRHESFPSQDSLPPDQGDQWNLQDSVTDSTWNPSDIPSPNLAELSMDLVPNNVIAWTTSPENGTSDDLASSVDYDELNGRPTSLLTSPVTNFFQSDRLDSPPESLRGSPARSQFPGLQDDGFHNTGEATPVPTLHQSLPQVNDGM